jgi:hypothetical protein
MLSPGSLPQSDRKAIEERLREEVERSRAALLQALPDRKSEALKQLHVALEKLNDLVMNGTLREQ